MKPAGAGFPTLWLCCVAVAAVIVARAHYITDLSAFLPASPTPTQQLLVDQLRDGPASRLILIAIEGGDAALGCECPLRWRAALRRDRQFSSVTTVSRLPRSAIVSSCFSIAMC